MTELHLIDDPMIVAQIAEQCQLSTKNIQDVYPCTPVQSGMMVDAALYVHTIVHKIDSHVDLSRFCHALDQIVVTNQVLRTRIVDCDGHGLLQAVVEQGEPVLRSEGDINHFLKWDNLLSTDLGTPLAKFAIVTSEDATRLVTTMHHVIFDLHVLEFLIQDAWSLYQGVLPPEHAPFSNFAKRCNSIDAQEASKFWKKRFTGGASTFPHVPAGHQPIAREIITHEMSLPQGKAKARPSIALMPAYIEAAWALTVSDYTSNDSVAFGNVLSGRGPGAETTFGPTITSVPVQVELRRNMSIQQLVRDRVTSRREMSTSHFLHFGLAKIRAVSDAARVAASFQSALSIVHGSHAKELGNVGLTLDEAHTEEPPKPHGLLLICTPSENLVNVKTLFDPEVLEPEQVRRVLRQMEHRLGQLVKSPSSTPLKKLTALNFGDTLELMEWNSQNYPTVPIRECLNTRIAARARGQPDDLAVKAWDGEATYAELMTIVDNLAHKIIVDNGNLAAEETVCIIIGRSLSLVVALLAVMRLGATCVPIDPSLPKARKETIITQCQARLVLTSPESSRGVYEYNNNCATLIVVPDRHITDVKTVELPPDNAPSTRAAFMIFTSGSTGQPKGVIVEHRSFASSVQAWTDAVGWERGSRVLQYSSPSFDACAGEIMGSLQAGACVCIPSERDRESALGDFMKVNKVNHVGLTPTTLRTISPEDVLPELKSVASAGEPITTKVFDTWCDKVHLVNAWGPTEASVVASMGHLTPDARYRDSIGKPLGCALWIVDSDDCNRLLPIGAVGEMLIESPGVARGYYLAPDLTRASFIEPPAFVPKRDTGLESRRLYRTGDLARYNPDGTIGFLGRCDNQVKIRGQRFELGEVETAIGSHKAVADLIVTTYHKTSGSGTNKDLVAVLTLSNQKAIAAFRSEVGLHRIAIDEDSCRQLQTIQEFARDRFPTFMVPTVWLVVAELPHTPSKKVDRVRIKTWLDTLDMSAIRESLHTISNHSQTSKALTPPSTAAEITLQQTWSTVLHIDPSKIGKESSFMVLGGDSITAMQVATRCRKKGFQVIVADLLRKATLAELAQQIQTIEDALPVVIPKMDATEETRLRPLSPVQRFLSEDNGPASHNQFNQGFLLDLNHKKGSGITPKVLELALGRIVAHHPMLRSRFSYIQREDGTSDLYQKIVPINHGEDDQRIWSFRVHHHVASDDEVWSIVSTSQSSLDIRDGPVFSTDVIINPEGHISILFVAHHLAIDLISWRILWEDLEAVLRDKTCSLPPSFPFPLYVQSQHDALKSTAEHRVVEWPKADCSFWGMEGVEAKVKDMLRVQHTLSTEQTALVMGESCNTPFSTTPVILLLAAVVLSFTRVFPDRPMPALYNESHGRDLDSADGLSSISRTIGWFTTLFPLTLKELKSGNSIKDVIMAIKDEYHHVSQTAIEQFALQVLSEQTPSSFRRNNVELAFNFAGRMQQVTRHDSLLRLRSGGPPVHLDNVTGECEAVGLLSIYVSIEQDDKLTFTLDYNRHIAHQGRINHWIKSEMGNCFTEMTTALSSTSFTLTHGDLPLLRISPGLASLRFLHSQLEDLEVAHDNVESIYPCTATQDGILFAQFNGHDYHNRFIGRLTSRDGDVDIDRVKEAWKAACHAHPILRTVFTTGLSDQSAFQQIVLKANEPSISMKEIKAGGSISEATEDQEKMGLDHKKPRHHLTLYRESASVVHMVVDISHTLADAKTFQALFNTIGSTYSNALRGKPAIVAPGRPFSDYVVWLQDQQQEARKYWKNYLKDVQPCIFPRDPIARDDYRAAGPMVPFHGAQKLSHFCQEQGVTHAMFMQAAWALVLRKYTGNSTVCFGSVRSDQEVLPSTSGSADILGPLISMLPCKFDIGQPDSMTVMDVLDTARNDVSKSMSYSGCYLAELHDELGLGESSLFDTIMTIQRAWSTDLSDGSGHLSIEITEADDPTEYSVVVGVQYSETGVRIRLSHQRAHVSDALVRDMAETLAEVMNYMLDSAERPLKDLFHDPSQTVDLDLLKKWNAKPPIAAAADENIPSFFRTMAQSQGSAPAVCSWERDLSYRELDVLSDRLAYRLRAIQGVKADDIVPFCCIKAASAIVVMLAIWKAGAALLPLDFSHPEERISAILQETEAKLVLVNDADRVGKMQGCFPSGTVDFVDVRALETFDQPDDAVQRELSSFTIEPQHAGYVVYTSGSTGQPKGLILHSGSIATSTMYHAPRLGLTSKSRVLQLTNFVFDFGLLDVMFSLYAGACICMPSEQEATNDVSGAIRRTDANYVECTPTYASLFNPENAPSLRTVVLAGEAMKQENIDTWVSHARIMNGYGPGETGMSSCGDVPIGEDNSFSQDIGAPFGCRYWVVDPTNHHELVPIGTSGELVIEGPIVGRGYVNKPEATAAAFIEPPAWTKLPQLASIGLDHSRFYKSGDLVTQRSAESFIFDGRKDYQVKIRGQRIEMGEIEHHLNEQPLGVSKWAVEVIKAGTSQEITLAAFCEVLKDDALLPSGFNILPPRPLLACKAKEVLRKSVPSYMVPEFFVPLETIPTTGSMKTDRKALRTIAGTLTRAEMLTYRAARQDKMNGEGKKESLSELTDLELLLRNTWAGILDMTAQSIHHSDDFFALGGNSIRAMRLVAALRSSGYLLSVSDIFKSPICAEMALKISPLSGHINLSMPSSVPMKTQDISQLKVLAQTRSYLNESNIEAIAPATDLQATMLSEAYRPGGGSMIATITLEPLSGGGQKALDWLKLQEACEKVISRHAILRTIFIQNDRSMLQLALYDTKVEQVGVYLSGEKTTRNVSASSDLLDVLPHFKLISGQDGTECLGLQITIHHAHYDAISMGHILEDLRSAYVGADIVKRHPSFHEWATEVPSATKTTETCTFWQSLLEGSNSQPLSPVSTRQQSNENPGSYQYDRSIDIPAVNIQSPHGTPATVLKAAWSCILAEVVGQKDPVFGFLSANRFLGGFSEVPGPCINLIPVRAPTTDTNKTMSCLIKELQQQYSDSLAHQHLGFRSMIKDCTQWSTTRFNSAILFQNHESFGQTLLFGESECTVTGVGQGTNSADVWVTATPQPDTTIHIELNFSRDHVPLELSQWIANCLEELLARLPLWLETRLGDIRGELIERVGPIPVPIERKGVSALVSGRHGVEDVVDRILEAGHFRYV
ncbi:nonribosomal peptide synthase [Fusarium longipes]|uniref:Nonribosomal peptide synthase n=1 Tax=Fusarium longipes TaxID=694270 RepID=A0A395S2F4_9HYPO|nr:nonribosomal peptide synthase [Fusarium longipes]